MKVLLFVALCALAGCSTNSINPAFKGSEADQAIQKARALPGFNAANFLPGPATEKPPLLKGAAEISAALAKGGYIVYMRHGRTQYEQLELERENRAKETFDLDKCETQRSLSNEGRAAMKVSGAYFRKASIPIAQSFVMALKQPRCFLAKGKSAKIRRRRLALLRFYLKYHPQEKIIL
jgi:hypothetical protein